MNDAVRSVPAPRGHDNPFVYILLALLATAGFFYVNISPSFYVAFTDALGFTDAQAGFAISANIFGMALGGLIAVYLVHRFHWRAVLTALLTGVLVLEIASMWISTYALMWPLRAADGIVGGASVGVALSLLGRTHSPDRAFGTLLAFQFGLGGLGNWVLPDLIKTHGSWVVFAVMAGMNLAAVITAVCVRLGADTHGERVAGPQVRHGVPVVGLVVAALIALFLFQTAEDGLLAFIYGIAADYGLPAAFSEAAVGTTTWIGMLGALFVILIGLKFGRVKPVSVFVLMAIVGMALFLLSSYMSAFYLANVLSALAWAAVVPYLFGMVSRLDRSGHLATLAGFSSGAGLACGPALAGYLIEHFGSWPSIAVSVALLIVAAIAAIPAAVRLDRLDRAEPVAMARERSGRKDPAEA